MSEYIRKLHGCSPDAFGNMPCDYGFPCDACTFAGSSNELETTDPDDDYFSPYEYYKDKQSRNANLPNYSEGLALHDLLKHADLALDESNDEGWIDDDTYDQFTININGQSIAFLLGAPQFEALIAFIKHIAAENMHYVDPKLKYVKGSL